MRLLSAALSLILLLSVFLMPAGSAEASEIRQESYVYSYKFAKDPGGDYVYAIRDAFLPAERLALKPKALPLVVKVVIPDPTEAALLHTITSQVSPVVTVRAEHDLSSCGQAVEPTPPEGVAPSESKLFATIYFSFGSSSYKASEEKKLVETILSLKEQKNKKVKVSGYTCDIGSKEYNDRLAMSRANTVVKRLEANGIKVDQVSGEGECCYASENKKSLNRRVEISVQR